MKKGVRIRGFLEEEKFVVIENWNDKRALLFGSEELRTEGGQYRGRRFTKTMNADTGEWTVASVGDTKSWSKRTHMTSDTTSSSIFGGSHLCSVAALAPL